MAAEQGEVEGRAVQNALGLEGLQTGNPARREPLHLSSARDQPCPPAEQRWATLAARTQRPPSPGSPCCCDSSARSPEPPLTNRFAGSLWGGCTHFGHKSRTKGLWLCRIRWKGTWETGGGHHHRAVVCPLAGLGLSVHWEVNKWRTSLLRFGRWVSSVFSIK